MKVWNVIVIAILLCAGIMPHAASASTILEFTEVFGPEAAASPPHSVATLPKFNPAFGELLGVTLELDAGISGGKVFFDNEGAMGGSVTLGYGGTVEVSAMGITATAMLPLQLSDSTVSADIDGPWDFLGADASSFAAGAASDSASTMLNLKEDFLDFIGPGTFDAILSSRVRTHLETTGPYGPISTDPGVVEGSITVRYEYVIPEPTTALLLCLGGIVLIRRRF